MKTKYFVAYADFVKRQLLTNPSDHEFKSFGKAEKFAYAKALESCVDEKPNKSEIYSANHSGLKAIDFTTDCDYGTVLFIRD